MREPRDPLLKVIFIFIMIHDLKKIITKSVGFKYKISRDHGQLTRHAKIGNDPSAGSPTETLLRLLLPLNDQV